MTHACPCTRLESDLFVFAERMYSGLSVSFRGISQILDRRSTGTVPFDISEEARLLSSPVNVSTYTIAADGLIARSAFRNNIGSRAID
jgi:hypothetical protein